MQKSSCQGPVTTVPSRTCIMKKCCVISMGDGMSSRDCQVMLVYLLLKVVAMLADPTGSNLGYETFYFSIRFAFNTQLKWRMKAPCENYANLMFNGSLLSVKKKTTKVTLVLSLVECIFVK